MKSSKLVRVAALATSFAGCTSLFPSEASAQHVSAGALTWYHGSKELALNHQEKKILGKYLHKKCRVMKMNASKRAFFARAVAHINAVLTSPSFAEILRAKARFVKSNDTGAVVLEKLLKTGNRINVFTYERDAGHPCNGEDKVNGHTNAFAPVVGGTDTALLFIFDPYLEKQKSERDVRELARTVIHESLHTMGYSHAGVAPWSAQYLNTVPAYVGCVVQHWSASPASIAWIKANCHKASQEQAPAPT